MDVLGSLPHPQTSSSPTPIKSLPKQPQNPPKRPQRRRLQAHLSLEHQVFALPVLEHLQGLQGAHDVHGVHGGLLADLCNRVWIRNPESLDSPKTPGTAPNPLRNGVTAVSWLRTHPESLDSPREPLGLPQTPQDPPARLVQPLRNGD